MSYRGSKKWECISGSSWSLEEHFLQVLLEGVLDGLTCLLLAISLNELMRGMYPDIYAKSWVFIPVFIGMMVYSVVNCILKNLRHSWIRFILDGIIVAVGIGYFVELLKKPLGRMLGNGWFAIVNHFLEDYNSFYNTHYLYYIDTPGVMVDLWSIILVTLAVAMGMLAIETGKKWIVFLPGVILMGIGLWVGNPPCASGLLIIVVGGIFLASPVYAGKKQAAMIGYLVAALLGSLLLTKVVFTLPANLLSTNVYKELNLKDKFIAKDNEKISQYGLFQSGNIEVCEVTNDFPEYKNQVDLYVYTRRPPVGLFYLRGAYGDKYIDGHWERSVSDEYIKENYKELAEYKEKKRAQLVASENLQSYKASGYDTQPQIYSQEYEILYDKLKADCVYLPYGVEAESLECKGSWYTMDYMVLSEDESKEYTFRALNSAVVYEGLESFCRYEPELEEQEFYDAYSKMVEKEYTQVPGEQTTAIAWAKEIKANKEQELIKKKAEAKLKEGSAAETNLERLFYAGEIKKALQTRCVYSKNVNAREDVDVVEYFLSEGHKGFCVHFASAGVFMLRQMGIPARLAYGYVVPGQSFRTEDKANYFTPVRDNKMHVWPEIYLKNYGWVPFEMTPGYESKEQILVEDESYVGIKEERKEEEEEPKDEEELLKQITSNTGTKTTAKKKTDLEKAKKVILKQLFVILCVCVAVAVLFLGWITGYRQWCYRRLKHLQVSEEHDKCVLVLRKLLYLEVCLEQREFLRFETDRAYIEYLKACHPSYDWSGYLAVLHKNAFSEERITKEEWEKAKQALFCIKRYKRASRKGENV